MLPNELCGVWTEITEWIKDQKKWNKTAFFPGEMSRT